MEILNLVQGSDEWLEARLNYLCASEAPAMMNCSKFMSRNQLLDLKKGWISNPDSSFKKKLFEKGHVHEAEAREILEFEEAEDFPSVVGLLDEKYLASFDGLSGDPDSFLAWEHKDWNATLSENVRNGVLEAFYYWQLEHQMLVSGTNEIMFTCSDGTEENRVSMTYRSDPKRREELIAGWDQFLADLEVHKIEAKNEVIVANEAELFPIIKFEVVGSEIISNIEDVLAEVEDRANVEMNRKLETDQDFADKEKSNKATKEARDNFKLVVQSAKGKFGSFSEFESAASKIDQILQKMQSQGEKQVKQAKEQKKTEIQQAAQAKVNEFVQAINQETKPLNIASLLNCNIDFATAMKNKRTIESIENAVDSAVAEFKINANELKALVVGNLATLREMAGEYKFLFNDTSDLVLKDNEALVAIIKTRISEHKIEAEEKLEAEREKIRAEEAEKAKAEQLKKEQEKVQEEEKPAPYMNTAPKTKRETEVPVQEPESEKPSEPEAEPEIEDQIAKWFQDNTEIDSDEIQFIVNAIIDGEIPHLAVI